MGTKEELGALLRARMKALGKNIPDLEDELGLNRGTLSRILRGESWPRPGNLDDILGALETTLAGLYAAGRPDLTGDLTDLVTLWKWLSPDQRALHSTEIRKTLVENARELNALAGLPWAEPISAPPLRRVSDERDLRGKDRRKK